MVPDVFVDIDDSPLLAVDLLYVIFVGSITVLTFSYSEYPFEGEGERFFGDMVMGKFSFSLSNEPDRLNCFGRLGRRKDDCRAPKAVFALSRVSVSRSFGENFSALFSFELRLIQFDATIKDSVGSHGMYLLRKVMSSHCGDVPLQRS